MLLSHVSQSKISDCCLCRKEIVREQPHTISSQNVRCGRYFFQCPHPESWAACVTWAATTRGVFTAAWKCSSFQIPALKAWSYLAACWLGEIPESISVLKEEVGSFPAEPIARGGLGLKPSPLSHCTHINSRAAFSFTGMEGFVPLHGWMLQPKNTGSLPGENGRRTKKYPVRLPLSLVTHIGHGNGLGLEMPVLLASGSESFGAWGQLSFCQQPSAMSRPQLHVRLVRFALLSAFCLCLLWPCKGLFIRPGPSFH